MEYKIVCQNDNIELREELKLNISRRFYKNLKAQKTIFFVNNKETKLFEIINKNDVITFNYTKTINNDWQIDDRKLDIIYENDNYIIINKPTNLLSIPTKAEPYSLYQQILNYLGDNNTISIINRLDKETKGLCLVAKNRFAAYKITPVHKKITRKYLAILNGILENKEGVIDNYIAKDLDSNKRYITLDSNIGKRAITNYKVIKEINNKSIVEFVLETGRTHQIRLHAKYLGHPIIGDKLYSDDTENDLMLFSYYIKYYDEFINETIEKKLDINLEELI